MWANVHFSLLQEPFRYSLQSLMMKLLRSVLAGEALSFFVPPGDLLPLLDGDLLVDLPRSPDLADALRPLPPLALPLPGERHRY